MITSLSASGGSSVVAGTGGATSSFYVYGGQAPQSLTANEIAVSSVAGVLTIPISSSNTFKVTLTENVTSVIFDNWVINNVSQRVLISFWQDNIGGWTVAWPPLYWALGIQPVLTTTPNTADRIVIESADGGETVFADVIGKAYTQV